MKSILIFVSLFALTVWAQERPTISFISPDVVSDIGKNRNHPILRTDNSETFSGGSVELVCNLKNAKEYPILWLRLESEKNKNTLPISSAGNLLVRDNRFGLELNADEGTYKLTIKDVVRSDEGRYQCQVVADTKNVITADVDLRIKVPPVMKNDTDPEVQAAVGEDAELTCSADGFPSPQITWTREDGTLLPNGRVSVTNSRLVISKVKKEHRGKTPLQVTT